MSVISMSAEDEHHLFGTVEPTKGVWYPIETAPKDGSLILMFDGCIIMAWWDDGWYSDEYCPPQIIRATHWMPLPEPPK